MNLEAQSQFSYKCGQCGLCCRDKVITLSVYDVARMAHVAGLEPREAIARYTIRRGSLLKFRDDGTCVALEGNRCTLHEGRPLACRLYPLGMEVNGDRERFVCLEPAAGSAGVYGTESTIEAFLQEQGVRLYLVAIERFEELLDAFRRRLAELLDYDRVEPREFRRRAVREALAESNFDPNPIIDALYNFKTAPDAGEVRAIALHLDQLRALVARENDADRLASAAVLLAVSIGRSPDDAFPRWGRNISDEQFDETRAAS